MRLICNFPSSGDATSLYRGVGPLATLRRMRPSLRLELDSPAKWRWDTLRSGDACFMQRPAGDSEAQMVQLAKANHKPVWIDYDDDLFSVPESNPTSDTYNNPKIQNNMAEMISKANLVTVSTPFLANKMRAILERVEAGFADGGVREYTEMDRAKVVVVPNAYDTDLLIPLDFQMPPPRKIVMWRGSATHEEDLEEYLPAMASAFSRHRDWSFNFVGEAPRALIRALEKDGITILRTKSMDPVNYFHFMAKTRPALLIVPLKDSEFNRSKSNCAWLEATHAGACTLGPSWDEWQRPGIINYSNAATFQAELHRFMSGKLDAVGRVKASREFIREHLTLGRTNALREALLERLAGVS